MNKPLILLIVMLSLALAACGGQAEPTPQPTDAPAVEQEATQAPPTEVPPTEVPPTEAPAEETAAEEPTEAAPATVAEMEHTADPQLVDITWEWQRRDPNGGDTPWLYIEVPENYTLLFNADGTFSAKLDCNNGSGVYATPAEGVIRMELGPMTMAACPPESLSDFMIASFGGAVDAYRIEDGGDTLVLAWAENGPLDYYRNAAAPIAGEAEVESIPEDAIQLDLNGLADSFQWEVRPGQPLPQQGPGGQGFPPHILITFDGATADEALAERLPHIYLFPTQAYVDLYNEKGNETVAAQVVRLGQLIATADGRDELPESPMPLLPPPQGFMDRWAQFLDLDFGAGNGVRYVSDAPNRPSIGVWTSDSSDYYYQGLSTDQSFYVSLFWPVATSALPTSETDASEEQTAAATNPDTYPTYKQETIDTLNALAPADWTPNLDSLDALVASLTFPLPSAAGDEEAAEATPEAGGEEAETPADETQTEGGLLPSPGAGEASGTITAPDGVFVRSGPGTQYPDIGVAAYQETGKIVGVSEDGAWWVVEVPLTLSPDQQGWVSADWVEASNAAEVPVVTAPDLQAPPAGLVGVPWQWVSTTTPAEAITVNDPARYTIEFLADGSAAIKADCNNVGASYTADGSSINITLGASTLVACPPDSLDQQFLNGLEAAAITFFQEGDLYMDMVADGGTMRFRAGAAAPAPTPAPESPISPAEGVVFNLVSYGPDGAAQTVLPGTQITATFAGQTVSGNAGCNDYNGTVTPVSDYFTISNIAVTRKACAEPAGIMEQEQAYLAALAGTAGYQWQQDVAGGSLVTGGRLFYTLTDGTTGTLNFVAVQ